MNVDTICQKYGITKQAFKILSNNLGMRDIVLLIDDSGSMNLETRIEDAIATMIMLLEISLMFDSNGIDVMFLNQTHLNCVISNINQITSLNDTFEASGGTHAGNALNYFVELFKHNYASVNGKPVTLIYLGDGKIDDSDLFTQTIVDACKIPRNNPTVDVRPITFQLFQVGTDSEASKYFQELDTIMKEVYKLEDCVDTVSYEKMKGRSLKDTVLKILLGSVLADLD